MSVRAPSGSSCHPGSERSQPRWAARTSRCPQPVACSECCPQIAGCADDATLPSLASRHGTSTEGGSGVGSADQRPTGSGVGRTTATPSARAWAGVLRGLGSSFRVCFGRCRGRQSAPRSRESQRAATTTVQPDARGRDRGVADIRLDHGWMAATACPASRSSESRCRGNDEYTRTECTNSVPHDE
jgi:hypothetical protein